MHNSIILCEGETDQALIGCYLEKTAKWKYIQTKTKNNIFPNKAVCWYSDVNNNTNGIWQVAGNIFSDAVQNIFTREKYEHIINKLVIITDHDDEEAEQNRLTAIQETIKATVLCDEEETQLKKNEWKAIRFCNSFGEVTIQVLYLLIPKEEYGAMETFMMNALSEQNLEKEHVINESRAFIRSFQSNVYLQHRRERIKAELGVSLSIFSPDRIFTTMKELIDSVEWDKYTESHNQFKLLENI